jgi:hypothetical protein
MKAKFLRITLTLSAILLVLLTLSITQPALGFGSQNGPPLAPASVIDESWRYGVTVETSPPVYSSVVGRLLSESAAFRSTRAADIYFIFPASANVQTVYAARFYILSRSGAYTGNANLKLEVHNFAGALVRTVSSETIDLKTTSTGAWIDVALSDGNATLNPGQFLAFHFDLSAAAGGNLEVRPIFEVLVH